jgi:UDP-glucose 4-epimerase
MRPLEPIPETDLAARYAGRRCLVTGGLGFIGSNLTHALAAVGAEVRVVDSLEPRHGGNVRNIEGAPVALTIGDIADASVVTDALSGAEYIFNLAGQVSHVDSMEDPLRDLDTNARSQLAFLELVRSTNPESPVVYASTRQVYGRPDELPADEATAVRPVDVNGVSKLAAEQFHLLYQQVHGIPASVLRLSNVYGPRQRLEDHVGFLPAFLRRALNGEPIAVYGDGSQERDCLYVGDAVSALLAAGDSPAATGEVFNIGHHEHHTLGEIAEIVIDAAGAGDIVEVPWPEGSKRIAIDSYWTDYRRASEVLGWEPTWSLTEGLVHTIAYYRSRLAWHV